MGMNTQSLRGLNLWNSCHSCRSNFRMVHWQLCDTTEASFCPSLSHLIGFIRNKRQRCVLIRCVGGLTQIECCEAMAARHFPCVGPAFCFGPLSAAPHKGNKMAGPKVDFSFSFRLESCLCCCMLVKLVSVVWFWCLEYLLGENNLFFGCGGFRAISWFELCEGNQRACAHVWVCACVCVCLCEWLVVTCIRHYCGGQSEC